MLNTKFEAYKIAREIKRIGIICTVSRKTANEFGENSGVVAAVGQFSCIFHIEKSYVDVVTLDGTMRRSIGLPKVMCLKEDIDELTLEIGDDISLSNNSSNQYKLNEVNDVSELGIIVDISLTQVDDGNG